MSCGTGSSVAIRACGCFCAAIRHPLSQPGQRSVLDWVETGYTVRLASIEEVRSNPWGCASCKGGAAPVLDDRNAGVAGRFEYVVIAKDRLDELHRIEAAARARKSEIEP